MGESANPILAQGVSVFGVSNMRDSEPAVIFYYMMGETRSEMDRMTILSPDHARQIALRMMDEADAAEAGLRDIEREFTP